MLHLVSRRTVLAAIGGAAVPRFLAGLRGAALLLDFRTRRILMSEGGPLVSGWMIPPGSTMKPFTLQALLEARKLGAGERLVCPGSLEIGGRSYACTHPRMGVPLTISTAIAYSCNCFVAHFAERFAPGELARRLSRAGISGRVDGALTQDGNRLQAIGEDHVLVTPLALAMAYQRLASLIAAPDMAPILLGLEAAVEFGTAQRAQVRGLRVAGKTGSVTTSAGAHLAWFAGFAPSTVPDVVVTVVVQGRTGGGDAAPIAGRILQQYAAGRL